MRDVAKSHWPSASRSKVSKRKRVWNRECHERKQNGKGYDDVGLGSGVQATTEQRVLLVTIPGSNMQSRMIVGLSYN